VLGLRHRARGTDFNGGENYLLVASSVTCASPLKPKERAAAGVRSIMRPRTNGPRSLIVTTTERPDRACSTRTFVPNARVRWAAVNALGFNRSPFAVFEPLLSEYTEAIPDCDEEALWANEADDRQIQKTQKQNLKTSISLTPNG